MKIEGRVLVLMTALAGLSLSGCVSSPTYGTDKSAGAQLLDDVSNMASFGQGKKKERIDYKPRPDLVRPAPGDKGYLPAPQQSLASPATQTGRNRPSSAASACVTKSPPTAMIRIMFHQCSRMLLLPTISAPLFRAATAAVRTMRPAHPLLTPQRLPPSRPRARSRTRVLPRRAAI